MPEEIRGPEAEAKDEVSHPMVSGKGYLLLGGIILLEAVFFGVLLLAKQGDSKTPDTIGQTPGDSIDYISKYNVELKDFNQSVVSSGSQTMTLSMAMVIQLGRTQAEIRDGKKPTDQDMTKFQAAVQALVPQIRSMLVEKVNTLNYAVLSKYDGKRMLSNAVKDFVNKKLKDLDIGLVDDKELDRNRVQEVQVTTFFLQ